MVGIIIILCCVGFIIGTLMYTYSTYKPIVDKERAINKAIAEANEMYWEKRALSDLAQRMRLQVAKPIYTEPSKAEDEGMLLPYPDMK